MMKRFMKLSILITAFLFASTSQAFWKKKDIVDTAIKAGQFNTLVTAVQAAGLEETLRSKGPFTVFAPTDAAFAALPEGTVEYLLENVDELQNILLFHVAPGKYKIKKLSKKGSIGTANNMTLDIKKSHGSYFVNGTKVVMKNIKTSNGIIHVIDAVLIP